MGDKGPRSLRVTRLNHFEPAHHIQNPFVLFFQTLLESSPKVTPEIRGSVDLLRKLPVPDKQAKRQDNEER